MRTLLLLAALLAGPGSTGDATGRDALRSFKPEEFQRVEQVSAIPERVRNAVRDALHGQPLGEPGSRWNATDVVWGDNLPSRRLIFAVFSATRWFIYYEHGGRGHQEHVLLFSSEARERVLLEAGWAMLPQHAKSISELRAALGRRAYPSAEQ